MVDRDHGRYYFRDLLMIALNFGLALSDSPSAASTTTLAWATDVLLWGAANEMRWGP